jgi:hypothetical protein
LIEKVNKPSYIYMNGHLFGDTTLDELQDKDGRSLTFMALTSKQELELENHMEVDKGLGSEESWEEEEVDSE